MMVYLFAVNYNFERPQTRLIVNYLADESF